MAVHPYARVAARMWHLSDLYSRCDCCAGMVQGTERIGHGYRSKRYRYRWGPLGSGSEGPECQYRVQKHPASHGRCLLHPHRGIRLDPQVAPGHRVAEPPRDLTGPIPTPPPARQLAGRAQPHVLRAGDGRGPAGSGVLHARVLHLDVRKDPRLQRHGRRQLHRAQQRDERVRQGAAGLRRGPLRSPERAAPVHGAERGVYACALAAVDSGGGSADRHSVVRGLRGPV